MKLLPFGKHDAKKETKVTKNKNVTLNPLKFIFIEYLTQSLKSSIILLLRI